MAWCSRLLDETRELLINFDCDGLRGGKLPRRLKFNWRLRV